MTGSTERSQEYCAGALAALASKHPDNRQVIAKRLVGLLGSSAVREPHRADRVLTTCGSFTSDSAANQVAIAKLGGIPPLIGWLAKDALSNAADPKLLKQVQAQAAKAMLCLAADNPTTQSLIAKSDGIPPLITLVKKSSREAMKDATRCLWHIASQAENRVIIVEAGAIKPLIAMLAVDDDTSNELAAILMVRLAFQNADVCIEIANKAGTLPLVKLVSSGSVGSQQQAASCLAELALVPNYRMNRDIIAKYASAVGQIQPTSRPLAGHTPCGIE